MLKISKYLNFLLLVLPDFVIFPALAEITEESLACETAAYLFLQCIEKGKYANNVPDMSPYDLDSSALNKKEILI